MNFLLAETIPREAKSSGFNPAVMTASERAGNTVVLRLIRRAFGGADKGVRQKAKAYRDSYSRATLAS